MTITLFDWQFVDTLIERYLIDVHSTDPAELAGPAAARAGFVIMTTVSGPPRRSFPSPQTPPTELFGRGSAGFLDFSSVGKLRAKMSFVHWLKH